jgi:hypothetical protein
MPDKFPLAWPAEYIRTKIDDRNKTGKWKKTLLQYQAELIKELEKDGAVNIVVSTNVEPSNFGTEALVERQERRDPGVAVYFSIPPEEDFSWQATLGINDPSPSVEEINKAFREMAKQYHTDIQGGGNIQMFQLLNDAKRAAIQWVTGDYDKERNHVVACDAWTSIRWNMKAIALMIQSIRRAKATGATGMIERMYSQMKALPSEAGGE